MIIMRSMGNKYIRLSYWKQFRSRNHSEKMEQVRKKRDTLFTFPRLRTEDNRDPETPPRQAKV